MRLTRLSGLTRPAILAGACGLTGLALLLSWLLRASLLQALPLRRALLLGLAGLLLRLTRLLLWLAGPLLWLTGPLLWLARLLLRLSLSWRLVATVLVSRRRIGATNRALLGHDLPADALGRMHLAHDPLVACRLPRRDGEWRRGRAGAADAGTHSKTARPLRERAQPLT